MSLAGFVSLARERHSPSAAPFGELLCSSPKRDGVSCTFTFFSRDGV
jgi:hypothetical protein